jgi:hypothetical protein
VADITASARFDIELTPADGVLPGTERFDFTKTWTGDISGTSAGVMLSAGDPAAGTAGYVALETFEGTVDGRQGTLVFQQFGSITKGSSQLRYEVVPGSGSGELEALAGEVDLQVADGVHEVTVYLREA